MQPPVVVQPFDSGHLGAVVHDGQRQTRHDALIVDQDRAGSAGALVAALLGAGQSGPFAQHVQQ
jgi:hypothetical protein